MDQFELSLLPPYGHVEIRINGAPLLETIRTLEVPCIEAERAEAPNSDAPERLKRARSMSQTFEPSAHSQTSWAKMPRQVSRRLLDQA